MIIISKTAEAEINRLTTELDFARQRVDTLMTFTNYVMDLTDKLRAERNESMGREQILRAEIIRLTDELDMHLKKEKTNG